MLGSSSTSSARVVLGLRHRFPPACAEPQVSPPRARSAAAQARPPVPRAAARSGSSCPLPAARARSCPGAPRRSRARSTAPAQRRRCANGGVRSSRTASFCISGGRPLTVVADDDLRCCRPPACGPRSSRACPVELWCSALFRRFTNTCSSRSWSAQITGIWPAGARLTASRHSSGRHAIAASITRSSSHQSNCIRITPESIAEKSSRSSTRRPEPRGLGRDRLEEALLGVVVPDDVRREQARGIAADRRQRRAQLVAEPREECRWSSRERRRAAASRCASSAS